MNAEDLISVLIQLSKVDDHFDAFELTYIIRVAEELGFPQMEVERLLKSDIPAAITIPQSEEERMTVLYYLLFMMKIDTYISVKEKELIHHYGFKLGFSSAMINDFIVLIEQHKHERVPVKDMLAIIMKYKN